TLHPTPEHEAAVFEGAGKVIAADVAPLDLPVTVAVGTTEVAWGPVHFAEPLVAVLPQGRLSSFPLLGHFGPLEAPTLVAEDVRQHLARLA
ncbi:hypothetical protein B7486_75000, partial [cyanobacterium TDX16]